MKLEMWCWRWLFWIYKVLHTVLCKGFRQTLRTNFSVKKNKKYWKCPDLNVIECVCDYMKRQKDVKADIHRRPVVRAPTCLEQPASWVLSKLCASEPGRIAAVLKGGHTKNWFDLICTSNIQYTESKELLHANGGHVILFSFITCSDLLLLLLFSLSFFFFYLIASLHLSGVSQPEQWIWMLPSHLTGFSFCNSLGWQQWPTHTHTKNNTFFLLGTEAEPLKGYHFWSSPLGEFSPRQTHIVFSKGFQVLDFLISSFTGIIPGRGWHQCIYLLVAATLTVAQVTAASASKT